MRGTCFLVPAFFVISVLGLFPRSARGQDSASSGLKANLDLPFDAGGGEESDEESPETVVFYGEQYEGTGFFFCCEKVLGCDGGVAFRKMQKELLKSIGGLSDRSDLGLVFFDSTVQKFPESGKPLRAGPGTRETATQTILKVRPGHGCCPKAALIAALDFSSVSSAFRKVIIYIGEGWLQCGPDTPAQIMEAVSGRNVGRIPIHVVGTSWGHDVNEQWLKRLAAENRGTYRRALQ
jgi:hypothetical protein